jgi:hypothetical protein
VSEDANEAERRIIVSNLRNRRGGIPPLRLEISLLTAPIHEFPPIRLSELTLWFLSRCGILVMKRLAADLSIVIAAEYLSMETGEVERDHRDLSRDTLGIRW